MKCEKFQLLDNDQLAECLRLIEDIDWLPLPGLQGQSDYRYMANKIPKLPIPWPVDGEPVSINMNKYGMGDAAYRLSYHSDGIGVTHYSQICLLCLVQGYGEIEFVPSTSSKQRDVVRSDLLVPGECLLWDNEYNEGYQHGGIFGGGRITIIARWQDINIF